MGTIKVELPAIYELLDRWVAVEPSYDNNLGCEIEYEITYEGYVNVLETRYTYKGEYCSVMQQGL